MERKYNPADFDWYAGEFMEKVYNGVDKWKKSGSVEDQMRTQNDMMALRTSLKVLASDGDITIEQRDEMLDYFLRLTV
ncbi:MULTISPECIES: hypothetical protein [Erysipelotrichaceae]|uniref:hypothetical protein n=1 Tax=Erysipelotrichaceae TaxID=128827 RepID=UPI0023532986|nr:MULTISPECIES: hypothetical protein [Erysipelotrichaceae]